MAGTSPIPCSSSPTGESSAHSIDSSLVNKCFINASSLRHCLDPLGIGVPLSSDDCVWIKGMIICGPLGTSLRVLGRVGCLVIGTRPSSCIWDGILCAICHLLTIFPSVRFSRPPYDMYMSFLPSLVGLSFMNERLLYMVSLWCHLDSLTTRTDVSSDDSDWDEYTSVWWPPDVSLGGQCNLSSSTPVTMFAYEQLSCTTSL
jgi:hypothetical protein